MSAATQHDYSPREVQAARRVLVDLGQVLGAFFDEAIVIVGGWVPELLLHDAPEPHVGSLDVDLALDPEKLTDGRYAELVDSLLETGRYTQTRRPYQLKTTVDLKDGYPQVQVDVEFLKPKKPKPKKSGTRRSRGFRPLDADACAAAFIAPQTLQIAGQMISGAHNRVDLRVASLPDFLIMKAFALAGREKAKDAYDICYCLDHAPGGLKSLASIWRERRDDPLVMKAVRYLRDKFSNVDSYGPRQVVAFYDSNQEEERQQQIRRSYELVAQFLRLVEDPMAP